MVFYKKLKRYGFLNKIKKGTIKVLLSLMFVGSVLGASGCATMGSGVQSNIGYDEFYDSYGDYKLVKRSNDIWMEKLDGSKSKQITYTPNLEEGNVFFTSDGKYIAYFEYKRGIDWSGNFGIDKFYVQKKPEENENLEERKEIRGDEFWRYFDEWQARVNRQTGFPH